MHKKRIMTILLCLLLLFIAGGLYYGLNVQHYTLSSEKITQSFRIALITDLHSCKYGENASKIMDVLKEQAPDIVLLGGDIFDASRAEDNAKAFLSQVGEQYNCYFVTGNHEYSESSDRLAEKVAIYEEYGIQYLNDEAITISVKEQEINLCGINDASIFSEEEYNAILQKLSEIRENGNYTILLAHRPLTNLQDSFDLILSGHTHGGQWRIPYLINGLYVPDQGLFPKYAGGEYTFGDSTMIVSRGLAVESNAIPRFYNRPEIVIVDINAQ